MVEEKREKNSMSCISDQAWAFLLKQGIFFKLFVS
jgi:hypothetical protein